MSHNCRQHFLDSDNAHVSTPLVIKLLETHRTISPIIVEEDGNDTFTDTMVVRDTAVVTLWKHHSSEVLEVRE